MGLWSLFLVASKPILEIVFIGVLGAFLASGYSNILTPGARKDINKIVYVVFTPALVFSSLASSITLQDAASLWFMPVNIGIIYLVGGVVSWVLVMILRPPPQLRGLIISFCTAANFGNLPLIIIPAVCEEHGNPFRMPKSVCSSVGLSYVSFSMAIGNLYIWSHTFSLMKRAGQVYQKIEIASVAGKADQKDAENQEMERPLLLSGAQPEERSSWEKIKQGLLQVAKEMTGPPTLFSVAGFVFGVTPWLKFLIIGDNAPLRAMEGSVKLLGGGLIPCVALILGGNLVQGMRKSEVRPSILAIIVGVKYVVLPAVGIAVVNAARRFGFVPDNPLYLYLLMVQYTLPPAVSIGTMSELYSVGQQECSVIFLWTYLIAAVALTAWSTAFMSMLS